MQNKIINDRLVKKLLNTSIVAVLILASFSIFFVGIVKAQPLTNVITVVPPSHNVTIGDTFNLSIHVSVGWEITNVTLSNITFEPVGRLNYTLTAQSNLSEGQFLSPESPGSYPGGGIYNSSGYAKPIAWNGTAVNNTPKTLANITWYANGVGLAYINITGATYNDSGTNHSTILQNATVLIHPQWPSTFTATPLTDTKIRLNFTKGIGADRIIVRGNESDQPPMNFTEGYLVDNTTNDYCVDSGLNSSTQYSYSAWGWNSTANLFSLMPNSTGSNTHLGGSGWFISDYSSDVTPRYIENNTQQKFNFSLVSETGPGQTLRLHNLTITLPQNFTFMGNNGTSLQDTANFTVLNTSNMIMWNATDYATGFLFDGTKNFWFNVTAAGGLESTEFQIIAYNNYSQYQSITMTVFITTNFSFTGSIVDIDGNPLQGATANITVSSFSAGGPPVTLGSFTNDTNATGHFNVTGIPTTEENVSGLQQGPMGGGGSMDMFYSLSAAEYEPTNTYAISISTSLPSLPISEFVTMLNNPEIYLKPAISFRVNTTGPNYNRSSGGIDNYTAKSFQMMVKDLRLGFPVKEQFTTSYEKVFSVPAARNYSLSIFPDRSFPVSIGFYNITSTCNDSGGDFNITGVNTTCMPYNGTYLVNVSVNVSYYHRWLNGSFNGVSEIADMRVVTYIMEDQDMVFENWALPFNLANESGGSDDHYNTTSEEYNISLPATMAPSYIMLRAYARNTSGVYYMGSHIISSSGGNLSKSIYNFTMSRLIQGINKSITSNNVSNNWTETTIVNTTAVLFRLVNSTGSLLSNENAFVEIKRELEGVDYMHMIDAQNGQFNISLSQGSSLKKLTIFSQQYAPVSTHVCANVLSGTENITTISCSNGTCNITMRSFGDFDPLNQSANFSMEMFKSNSTCNVPNPPSFCSLCAGQNKTEFSPFNAILAGDVSMMISSGNISVYYLNVDLLASGPPDAAFTEEATEAQGGLEAAWQFGSQGPDIYDAVLIKMPYNDSLHNRTINVTIPVLYDNEFHVIWNSSVNTTSDISSDPRLSDYTDYLNTAYEAYLNGTGVICNESDSTLSSGLGYKDTNNHTIWIKIPHFSGVGPLIGGDPPDPPSGFTATKSGTSQINLNWTKGSKADYTHVRRKTGSYPTSISDGTNVTNTTGTSKSDTGLSAGTTYYYSAWSWNATEGLWSTIYATSSATTDSGGGGYTPPSNNAPTADANGPYTGYVNQSISFDGTGSSDPDGDTLTYAWNFGDGGTATGASPTHSYNSSGIYNITLTVSDGSLTGTDTTTANISELPAEKQPPIADANGPYTGLTFQNITFNGSESYDPDGTITNYTWNFGDDTVGYGVKPTHSYNTSGLYNITLTVTDNDDLTDSNTTTINITLDSDGDGWSDDIETSYGTNATNATDYPTDTDGDGIPDEDSPDGNYTGDPDDDNDGLDDEIEQELGLDSNNASDVKNINDNITGGYLIDTNGDGTYDTFYNSTSKINTTIEVRSDGKYNIDTDGDGEWNYVYDPASEAINPYEEVPEGLPWTTIAIILVIVAIIIIVVIFFKTGCLYFEEKPKKKK